MDNLMDLYNALGLGSKINEIEVLDEDASTALRADEMVKRAYRKLVLSCHPDMPSGTTEQFVRVKIN